MKIFLTSLLIALTFGFSAQAQEGYLSCNNGNINEVGDSYIEVNLYEDGLEFMFWESSFSVDAGEVTYFSDDTIYVLNQEVTLYAEGDEYNSVVDAIIVLQQNATQMYITYALDKGPFASTNLKCQSIDY